MMQAPRAEPFAVAGAGAHDEGQPLGMLGVDVALLDRGMQHFRNAALHETGRADDVAIIDQRNGLLGRDDLVLHWMNLSPGAVPSGGAAGWPGVPLSGSRSLSC